MTRYISISVPDRCIVFIKVEKQVVCVLSNCDIADDFEWPLTTPNHLNFYILHRLSYLCNERLETSNLVGLHKLITASPTL